MKTTIAKEKLLEMLSGSIRLTTGIRQANENLGIFFHLKNHDLEVFGVHENRYYYVKHTFDGEVVEEVIFTIDTKKLLEFIQSLNVDNIQFEVINNGLKIYGGKTSALFLISRLQNIPDIDKKEVGKIQLNPKILSTALKSLLFCVAADSARPTLSSIKFIPIDENRILIISTDGFRLSLVNSSLPGTLSKPLQIPANFLRDVFFTLIRQDSLVELIFYENNSVGIKQADLQVGTQLVSGDFPPYERVMLKSFEHNIILSKRILTQMVKTMSIFARDYSKIVVFEFGQNILRIRPKKEAGIDNLTEMEVETQGVSPEDLKIAFNYNYILDYLSSVEDENITIRINRSDAPVLFLPGRVDIAEAHEGALYQHIIMPVRIQE